MRIIAYRSEDVTEYDLDLAAVPRVGDKVAFLDGRGDRVAHIVEEVLWEDERPPWLKVRRIPEG